MSEEKKCLHPECDKPPRGRGLCNSHYKQVRKLLAKGEADETDLIKRGLLLESKRADALASGAIFKKGQKETGRGVKKTKKRTRKKARS